MNARTYEQKQLTAMVVHLMDKVDAVLKKHDDIQSISDSEDTFGVYGRAIRKQHSHDKALDAKKVKKCAKAKKVLHKEDQLGGSVKNWRQGQSVKMAEEPLSAPRNQPRRRWSQLALGTGRFPGFI